MSYAIVGFGAVGQALAHAFARKNIEVTVASRRPPEALAPQARAIGPTVVAKSPMRLVTLDRWDMRRLEKAVPSAVAQIQQAAEALKLLAGAGRGGRRCGRGRQSRRRPSRSLLRLHLRRLRRLPCRRSPHPIRSAMSAIHSLATTPVGTRKA